METTLNRLPRKELLKLASQIKDLEVRLAIDGPQNDDELFEWIQTNLGVTFPRTPVCEGHSTPFKFIADLYFERSLSAVGLANRSGSKTFGVAVLHLLNSLYKPEIESASVGAIMAQSNRAYDHFRNLFSKKGSELVVRSTITKTVFKTGAKLEILPGTVSAVNGPHPQVVHIDELELMDPTTFQESRQMSAGKKNSTGRFYRAQDIITSTRKRVGGPMQKLIDQINDAKLNNTDPPYDLFVWCIFDCAERVENCICANPELPLEEGCGCERVVSGKWDDGSPRSLKDCCKGKLAKSNGWINLDNIKNTFSKSTRDIWEAQQECIKPSKKGLVFPGFSIERHGIRDYLPDPDNGPIYEGIDFGGTNAHAVGFYQVLTNSVEVTTYNNEKMLIKEGSRVCFDEIYKAEIANSELAQLIVERESLWRSKFPNFRVNNRFADPAGKAARLELARHKPPVQTSFKADKSVKEQIKICNYLVENDLFYVDVGRCEWFIAEIESWPYKDVKPGTLDEPEEPVDDFNHLMSTFRYAMININNASLFGRSFSGIPKFFPKKKNHGLPGMSSGSLPNSERWRMGLGGTINGGN